LNSKTKVETPVFIFLSKTLVNDFLEIKQLKRINGVGAWKAAIHDKKL
jgi:hypothetical protein